MPGSNLYSELIRAQLENLSSDPSAGLAGRVWWNTTSGKMLLDDATNIRAMLRNDAKLVFGNSGTASNNVRVNRSAASQLQFLLGDDATAEGSATGGALAAIQAKLGGSVLDASLIWGQISTPSTPASGTNLLYFKSDNNLYTKSSGGTETKIPLGNGLFLNTRTVTTTATIAASDDFIFADASGGAYTLTLPVASANTGKIIYVAKSSTDFNKVTISDVAATVSDNVSTSREVVSIISDGTSWIVGARSATGVWTSFTSAWTGQLGNPSVGNGTKTSFYRRVGDSLEVIIQVVSGNTTTYGSGTWYFGIPSGLTINATKLGTATSGITMIPGCVSLKGSQYWQGVPIYHDTTTVAMASFAALVTDATPEGWAALTANQIFCLSFTVPITGWNS